MSDPTAEIEDWREQAVARTKLFFTPIDGRFEAYRGEGNNSDTSTFGTITRIAPLLFRDAAAGLVVSMVAIPMAMGFAIASGLSPVHGIAGGIVSSLSGSLFGGSKYQVYGATAALIPVIASVMKTYTEPTIVLNGVINGGLDATQLYARAYNLLALVTLLSGAVMIALGYIGFGKQVAKVPHSIVVGFTIGIAFTIVMSQCSEILGLTVTLPPDAVGKLMTIAYNTSDINIYAVMLAVFTFTCTKWCLSVSVLLPGPIISLVACTAFNSLVLTEATTATTAPLPVIRDRYGDIPSSSLALTLPSFSAAADCDQATVLHLLYAAVGIVVVCSIESLLCSRMADRLARNSGQLFNPNKELCGQGIANIATTLLNGFPVTGALARTATNIKVGGLSPMSGVFQALFMLLLSAVCHQLLGLVPMACIGGILLFVAVNMVNVQEIRSITAMHHNYSHTALMLYCAAAVIATDFSTGVVSSIVIYAAVSSVYDMDSDSSSSSSTDSGSKGEKQPLFSNGELKVQQPNGTSSYNTIDGHTQP